MSSTSAQLQSRFQQASPQQLLPPQQQQSQQQQQPQQSQQPQQQPQSSQIAPSSQQSIPVGERSPAPNQGDTSIAVRDSRNAPLASSSAGVFASPSGNADHYGSSQQVQPQASNVGAGSTGGLLGTTGVTGSQQQAMPMGGDMRYDDDYDEDDFRRREERAQYEFLRKKPLAPPALIDQTTDPKGSTQPNLAGGGPLSRMKRSKSTVSNFGPIFGTTHGAFMASEGGHGRKEIIMASNPLMGPLFRLAPDFVESDAKASEKPFGKPMPDARSLLPGKVVSGAPLVPLLPQRRNQGGSQMQSQYGGDSSGVQGMQQRDGGVFQDPYAMQPEMEQQRPNRGGYYDQYSRSMRDDYNYPGYRRGDDENYGRGPRGYDREVNDPGYGSPFVGRGRDSRDRYDNRYDSRSQDRYYDRDDDRFVQSRQDRMDRQDRQQPYQSRQQYQDRSGDRYYDDDQYYRRSDRQQQRSFSPFERDQRDQRYAPQRALSPRDERFDRDQGQRRQNQGYNRPFERDQDSYLRDRQRSSSPVDNRFNHGHYFNQPDYGHPRVSSPWQGRNDDSFRSDRFSSYDDQPTFRDNMRRDTQPFQGLDDSSMTWRQKADYEEQRDVR